MKTLQELILEYFDDDMDIITESFDTVYDDVEICISEFDKRHPVTSTLRSLVQHMYEVWREQGGLYEQIPFIFDASVNLVKFNRCYKNDDSVQQYLTGLGIDGYQDSFSIGKQTIKWGSGSFSRAKNSTSVKTSDQETISTMFINKYFDSYSKLLRQDVDINDFGEYSKYLQYNDWLTSWIEQFNTIKYQLKGWSNIVAVRYGDKTDPVASELVKLHNRICKLKGISAKDALDPTDILLYNKSAQSKVVATLNCDSCEDDTVFMEAKNRITSLYDDKLYVGVSLKKGKSFVPMKLNYEPVTGFKNAHITEIVFDPISNLLKNRVDDFRTGKLIIDKNTYKSLKSTKQLTFKIDCDDEKGITLSVRTNHDGIREPLVCEPHLKRASAFMGKVPSEKWHSAIAQVDDVYASFHNKNTKKVVYDIDDLCERWDSIRSHFPNTTTSDDLRKIFKAFEPIEKHMNSELWSIYVQIHFLYGLFNTKDDEYVRHLLLWAEKIDERCLPYLLIKPA